MPVMGKIKLSLVIVVAVYLAMLTSCGNDEKKVGDSCDVTDQSFCKSDTVMMVCMNITRDREWKELYCGDQCPGSEGECVAESHDAYCKCAEIKPQPGDPCDKDTDSDFCRDELVLMTCSENAIGEQQWIEIECICVPQGQGRCEEDQYGVSCKC